MARPKDAAEQRRLCRMRVGRISLQFSFVANETQIYSPPRRRPFGYLQGKLA